MGPKAISVEFPYKLKRLAVLDTEMAYVDVGEGDPIVFLHGNPTWSYVWRNVIPHLEGLGRCLAPDLVGMGHSGRSPGGRYRFADHIRYLDAWFDGLGLTRNIVLIVQDWGAALGFYRTCRFPDQISGLAYMEAMVRPRQWSDMPDERVAMFKELRGPAGEEMVLEQNFFVEKMLFEYGVIRPLSEAEKTAYRTPFTTPESRWPTLVWPREIPFNGDPADNAEIVQQYSEHLAASSGLPKLFINAELGHGLAGAARDFCRTWPNQAEMTVRAKHYVQEDCPDEIGSACANFVRALRASGSRRQPALPL